MKAPYVGMLHDFAVTENYIAFYAHPLTIDYANLLAAPSWEHWLGTDNFGRDVLSRIIYGAQTALSVGFLASILGSSLARCSRCRTALA